MRLPISRADVFASVQRLARQSSNRRHAGQHASAKCGRRSTSDSDRSRPIRRSFMFRFMIRRSFMHRRRRASWRLPSGADIRSGPGCATTSTGAAVMSSWAGGGDIGAAEFGARSTIARFTIPDDPAIGPVGMGIRIRGGHLRAGPFIRQGPAVLRASRIDLATGDRCRCPVGPIARLLIGRGSIRRALVRSQSRGGPRDRIKTGEGPALVRRQRFNRCRRVPAAGSMAIGLPATWGMTPIEAGKAALVVGLRLPRPIRLRLVPHQRRDPRRSPARPSSPGPAFGGYGPKDSASRDSSRGSASRGGGGGNAGGGGNRGGGRK